MAPPVSVLDRPAAAERARFAPATALFAPPAPHRRSGAGEVHAHHGEIVQGAFYSADGTLEQALVTLPCSLYRSRARFRPLRSGPLTVEPAGCTKARDAARLTLEVLGRPGWGGSIRIDSNVPVSWGCGSSTTDVLATIRAVADAFDAELPPEWAARLAVASEVASDSLMYAPDRAVLFAQRRGSVLQDLGGPLPAVHVLGFNTEVDRGVETLSLPPCRYSGWEVEAFGPILGLLRRAVQEQDPRLLGRVASASTAINQRHRPKRHMTEITALARETGAAGVQVAHSGTVAGLLFEPGREAAERMHHARTRLQRLGLVRTWHFATQPNQPEVLS
ncbi:hypothetical protein [Longimicrobium sp.]|uniref:GHMP family kinase ATP-binding protein n=1 Tax=Longimicrobium sp. TaxID=2029185 RepID=UPI002BA7C758|nr:hypothetical protein [Longimicrobium sp.]HSU12936.1 hypothetical protein [Longimicrobium sp.]